MKILKEDNFSPKFPDEGFEDSVQRLKSESHSSLPSPLSF